VSDEPGEPSDIGGAGEGREPASSGLEHLQAAAREAIQAARAMLDVAEQVVEDPAAVQAAVGAIGSMVQSAVARVQSAGSGAASGAGSDRARVDDDDDDDDGRVERIEVS
jgi:hypothetical protein